MRARIGLLVRKVGTRQGIVVLVAVALLVTAGVFALQAKRLNDDPVLANRALLDQRDADELVAGVSRSLTSVLSYDWQDPDATRAVAEQVLQGQARKEYDTLFASLQQRAPGQKLTLSAQVQVVGVQELTESRAKLLVFLDQKSTRENDKQASVSAAQLSITAERKGGNWAIIGLKPL
ncbi:hypothetical protein EFK50_11700 [Nocardioides marmoriginsengisoli]|uniref:Mce-associated membrane protein n=1 Tax=Nocardioides marmoriginsengisoli TaxID=661483 RepID=A0A3N0CGJ0_9ACTN|nr:hypothetical protein [Nocardioides marmoriginsengisoli]RNL62429.1 hypothetical protein EFK50_11700 [Nocardioides marmoriginsengisoli]